MLLSPNKICFLLFLWHNKFDFSDQSFLIYLFVYLRTFLIKSSYVSSNLAEYIFLKLVPTFTYCVSLECFNLSLARFSSSSTFGSTENKELIISRFIESYVKGFTTTDKIEINVPKRPEILENYFKHIIFKFK